MARRKKGRKKAQKKISIVSIASLAPGAMFVYDGYKQAGGSGALRHAGLAYAGIDSTTGKFSTEFLMRGTGAIVVGGLIGVVGRKLGLNRALNIPYVKLF